MKEVKYSLYVHINPLDDYKSYVGISKNPKKRWGKNGCGYKGQQKFYYAIQKYGWKSFKHIILLKNLSLEEAWRKEKEYIKKYDSINDGYNVLEGGKFELSPEMRKNGVITKRFRETQVYISNLKTLEIIMFDTVAEASLKTGISEYWFFMYYKRQVPMLEELDITFGLESKDSQHYIELQEKLEKEKRERAKRIEKLSFSAREYFKENKYKRRKK